jgi:hypothetical protein
MSLDFAYVSRGDNDPDTGGGDDLDDDDDDDDGDGNMHVPYFDKDHQSKAIKEVADTFLHKMPLLDPTVGSGKFIKNPALDRTLESKSNKRKVFLTDDEISDFVSLNSMHKDSVIVSSAEQRAAEVMRSTKPDDLKRQQVLNIFLTADVAFKVYFFELYFPDQLRQDKKFWLDKNDTSPKPAVCIVCPLCQKNEQVRCLGNKFSTSNESNISGMHGMAQTEVCLGQTYECRDPECNKKPDGTTMSKYRQFSSWTSYCHFAAIPSRNVLWRSETSARWLHS